MTVAIVSGGLDSTVLLAWLADQQHVTTALSFDYGQRHRKELDAAQEVCGVLGVGWRRVDLRPVGALLAGSALTDESVPVPDGHYAEPSMRTTVVPNRNAIMLTVAAGVAVAEGHNTVAFAAHAGDHYIYPDCRPMFVAALQQALRLGNEGFTEPGFTVLAPFADWSKADIVAIGAKLGAPLAATWSCYRGEALHCGTCGTCTERREAFQLAGVPDPTRYQDTP